MQENPDTNSPSRPYRNRLWKPRSAVTWFLAILIGATFFGIAYAGSIVREEGMQGLFNRKRKVIERVAPDTMPVLDKVEESVMGKKQ